MHPGQGLKASRVMATIDGDRLRMCCMGTEEAGRRSPVRVGDAEGHQSIRVQQLV